MDANILNTTLQRFIRAYSAVLLCVLCDLLLSTKYSYPYQNQFTCAGSIALFYVVYKIVDRDNCHKVTAVIVIGIVGSAIGAFVEPILRSVVVLRPVLNGNILGHFRSIGGSWPLHLVGSLVCFGAAMGAQKNSTRIVYVFAFVSCLIALLLQAWQIGLIGASASTVYICASGTSPFSRLNRWKRVLTGCLVGLAICAVFLLPKRQHVGISALASTVRASRTLEIQIPLSMSDCIFGMGLSTYHEDEATRNDNSLIGIAGLDMVRLAPESFYERCVREFGMVGLLLFLRFVWCFIDYDRAYASSPPIMQRDRWLVTGIHAGCLALLVSAVFDDPLLKTEQSSGMFVVPLLVGISVSVGRASLPAREQRLNRRSRYAQKLGCLCGAILLALLLWQVGSAAILVNSAMPAMTRTVSQTFASRSTGDDTNAMRAIGYAAISAEDMNFYAHHGTDWEAIHRSLRRDIRSARLRQGGSTITMQTVRYMFLSEDKTIGRKLAELYLADYLERRLTKREILELYLNIVDFGLHSPGIDRASAAFFGKSAGELTLSEAAYLVGNLPHPPVNHADAESVLAEERRGSVLARIANRFPGKYSAQELEAAYDDKPVFIWERKRHR